MITCFQRRPTTRAAFCAALLVGGTLVGAGPAEAAPRSTGPEVLIVHVAPAASVSAVARQVGRALGGVVRHRFGSLHALSVAVPAGDAARVRHIAGVTSIEHAVTRHLAGAVTPNDPYFASKQALYLDAVDARPAWGRQQGNSAVTIAVLDSGVDLTHPDLQGKVVGRFAVGADPNAVTDSVGHGTFVSGVAAAVTNNHAGVAGAGWNTSLLTVKIADQDGNIAIDDEVAGIRWATAQHADVINLSLGGSSPSRVEASAIAAAINAGVVVVAAAGNEGDTARSYPAAYPGVIAVGATDPARHTRADFSNYGSWITVAAPGVRAFSTVPASSQMWGHQTSRYATADGTSFSTPLVAGEAALLRAQNRLATVAQIRHAIVASAHGYGGLGLGAGQVDFAGALRHLAPASLPTGLQATGSAGTIRFTAHSTAARVAFRVDGEPRGHSVPVTGGVASTLFGSWGFANGAHQLHAFDCTAYDECNPAASGSAFTIANPPPAVTAPAPGTTVTGRPIVRAASGVGGPLRLLVDGHARGFVTGAPYAFPVSTSELTDGAHVLQVQGCSVDRRHCAGPRSAAISIDSAGLHPEITALSPSRVSPNRDGVRDRTTLTFRLPDRETVRVRVLDAAGAIVRSYQLGTLAAGSHTWSWSATGAAGRALPDGAYALALDTVAGARGGWVQRGTLVDTKRPTLVQSSSARRLYPYRDGFRDSISLRARLGEPGRLTLTVRSSSGIVVRRLGVRRPAGPATLSWDGRTSSGRAVPAGRYQAQLALTDLAGNTTTGRTFTVTVSAERLRVVTRTVLLPAGAFHDAGGTAACATAKRADSRFSGGVLLTNRCASDGFDLAFADYAFRLPPAQRYLRIAFAARGASTHAPAELTAAFTRTDGSLEIPRYVAVRRGGPTWYRVASVPAVHHVTGGRRVLISLLLDSFYAGRNDFDVAQVRVRVQMVVLQ